MFIFFGEIILGNLLMIKLSNFYFIVLFSFVSDASHYLVVNHVSFIIKISFTVVLILFQVIQVTFWLTVGRLHSWLAFGVTALPLFMSPLRSVS